MRNDPMLFFNIKIMLLPNLQRSKKWLESKSIIISVIFGLVGV